AGHRQWRGFRGAPFHGHRRGRRHAGGDRGRDDFRALVRYLVLQSPQGGRAAQRSRSGGNEGAGMKAVSIGAVSALVLTGCALGPDYHRPELDLPADYGPAATDQSAPTIPPDWWTLYGDATLNRLVEQGLASSSNMKFAVA